MKRYLLIFVLFLFLTNLIAGELVQEGNNQKVRLFNKTNGKILTYHEVRPGKNFQFSTVDVDTVTIYTRIIAESFPVDYEYRIKTSEKILTAERSANSSKVTRTLDGKAVSQYNTYKLGIDDDQRIIVTNTSDYQMVIKVRASNGNSDLQDVDYVRFSPQGFTTTYNIDINGKTYTYYSAEEDVIRIKLEGPVLLKIISRLIFDDPLTSIQNYSYRIFENNEELAYFEEEARISQAAFNPTTPELLPSTGDINILKLSPGIHEISLCDCHLNREVIFRFYINKSSVEFFEK
ncbi:MAG: hypothetical protein JW784_04230 [Candidatus Cloacimonetes bacterium]|nr:hypothetical protein [Candidatus Cloacimonadota bacterium]